MATACIEWTRCKNANGYGVLRRGGRNHLVHRVALFDFMGIKASNLHVLHKCDNPGCVNPEHLYLGTHARNMADMKTRRRAKAGPGQGSGESNPASKLTAEQVLEIRRRTGEPQRRLAREFGVIQQTISDIQRRRLWRHI